MICEMLGAALNATRDACADGVRSGLDLVNVIALRASELIVNAPIYSPVHSSVANFYDIE